MGGCVWGVNEPTPGTASPSNPVAAAVVTSVWMTLHTVRPVIQKSGRPQKPIKEAEKCGADIIIDISLCSFKILVGL